MYRADAFAPLVLEERWEPMNENPIISKNFLSEISSFQNHPSSQEPPLQKYLFFSRTSQKHLLSEHIIFPKFSSFDKSNERRIANALLLRQQVQQTVHCNHSFHKLGLFQGIFCEHFRTKIGCMKRACKRRKESTSKYTRPILEGNLLKHTKPAILNRELGDSESGDSNRAIPRSSERSIFCDSSGKKRAHKLKKNARDTGRVSLGHPAGQTGVYRGGVPGISC